jgi:hypothetical protein
MRFRLRRGYDPPSARPLSPTDRWVNGAGFALWVPSHWDHEPGDGIDGWVPPSAVGRLSRFPVIATKERQPLTERHLLDHARLLARSLGVKEFAPVQVAAPDHLAVLLKGHPRGRYVFAVTHAWGEVSVAAVVWHTKERDDPDLADGIQAIWSLTPLREEDELLVSPDDSGR